LEIDKRIESFNLGDDIVVELKLGELFHAVKIIDLNDVYKIKEVS